MKTSGYILLLTPLISLPFTLTVATPFALPQTDTGYGTECYNKHCMDYQEAQASCAKSNGFDIWQGGYSPDQWKGYQGCICTGSPGDTYQQCIACYTPDSKEKQYFVTEHDTVCGGNSNGSGDTSSSSSSPTSSSSSSPTPSSSSSSSSSSDNTNDSNTENKKNDAGSLNLGKMSTGLRMAGVMIVAWGVMAAM